MKTKWPYILLYLMLAGCLTKHSEPLPIPEDKLEAVMIDVHVAESAISGMQNGEKKDSLINLYYNQIAEIYQMDRETLDSCIVILQRNPELASEVYGKMSEQVEKKVLNK